MCGRKAWQSNGMFSFVTTAAFYIITSLANLQFFIQTQPSIKRLLIYLFLCGMTAVLATSLFMLCDLTQLATPYSVGFLWTRDRSVAEAYIRNRHTPMPPASFEPVIPASALTAYLRLRPRGCCNLH
jgi:hypothetical protein